MDLLPRSTLRSGAIGAVVGVVLGYIPLVTIVAPLLAGGVAGLLERHGPRRGAMAGIVAGVLLAVLNALVSWSITLARFGELPFAAGQVTLPALAVATLLSLLAAGGIVVASAIGGALGGLLIASERSGTTFDRTAPVATMSRRGRLVAALVGLVAGAITFGIVALSFTAALDPFIWPSALVGLPIGFVAGAAVAVLGYTYLLHRRDPGRRWRRVGGGALAVAVVVALVVGGLLLLGGDRIDETAEHTYSYEVTLAPNRTITDATFYVPVPITNDTSEIGELFVEEARFSRDVPIIQGYEPDPEPVAFTYELVETERGLLLAITTDRIEVTPVYYRRVENETMGWHERIEPEAFDPTDPTMGVMDDGSFTFSVSVTTNRTIDTADPFAAEPLLTRTSELRSVDCRSPGTATVRCYEYDSHGYASYDADDETLVYVGTRLEGRNEWFSGGWSGNEYREWRAIELGGPQDGWHVTTVELEVGNGNYR